MVAPRKNHPDSGIASRQSAVKDKEEQIPHSVTHFFISIQTQNPVARCLGNGRVLLGSVTFPFFNKNFRSERFRDFDGAVGRARVDDDDLAFAVGSQRLHAGERPSDVCLLVVGDDDDGENHAGLLPWRAENLPSCARLGRAGAPVPTRAFSELASPMTDSFTERGYAR